MYNFHTFYKIFRYNILMNPILYVIVLMCTVQKEEKKNSLYGNIRILYIDVLFYKSS